MLNRPPSSSRRRAAPARVADEPAADATEQPLWQSRQLFGRHSEIRIEHGGAVYRLRITALGKLILTK